MADFFRRLFNQNQGSTGPQKETPSPVGQMDLADQIAQSAASILSTRELTPYIATRMLEEEVEAQELYAVKNIYGSDTNESTFMRATKIEKQKDLEQESLSDVDEIASRMYSKEIEEISQKICSHFGASAKFKRTEIEPVILSVHTSDMLIGQAVIKLAVNAAINTIMESAKIPQTNGFDLNGGAALVVKVAGRFSRSADDSSSANIIRNESDGEGKSVGTGTATGLLVIAGPNDERRTARFAAEDLTFFRSKSPETATPSGSPPLVIVPTNSRFKEKNSIIIPAFTEQQWEKTYIPGWIKKLGITKAVRDIAGPNLSRVDTMLAVATIQHEKDSWNDEKETFEKQFKRGEIPPAILRSIAINMIRFGTRFQYEHLNDPSNLARAMQKLLGITGFMDETGVIPKEKIGDCLKLLKDDKDEARRTMIDSATELKSLAEMTTDSEPVFRFKSFGLFAVLRQLNKQEVMLNTTALTFTPETVLCCGHCMSGVKMTEANCSHCGGPQGSYVFKIIQKVA